MSAVSGRYSGTVGRSSPRRGWRPRGVFPWLVTVGAFVFLALMAVLAYCMVMPVRWDGPGSQGALALFYPLHLLLLTLLSALLVLLARWRRARLAARLFSFSMVLTAVMALTPAALMWAMAKVVDVPLSLDAYLANAWHVNFGTPQPERTVVYGTARDSTRLELDVWPTGRRNAGPLRPAMVVVHGGAWTHGNRGLFPDWNRWLNELGYEVFDVEYRMPPPVRWLDEVGDVKSALGWLSTHAAEYHVDPARISVMGASAGGNLCMLAAYSAGDSLLPPSTDVPAVRVRTVINFYGPSDLALLYRTCRSPDYVLPLMEQYIGGAPDEFPERYRMLSPLTHITGGAPPTITLLGTSDRLVPMEQAELLDRALAGVGVPHELYLLPANDHGFDANWGGFGTQVARAAIKRFLARYDR